jgi:2-oxoglutarate ferredoxin oxidoreductase subunit alpha
MAKMLRKGNEAIGEAAIAAGCRFFFGYPITPQNEIPEYFSARLPEVGGVFLQAESEIAAINMVYGAAAAGARVMTSSSSPGVALKQEGISFLCASELPCVIVNVMRGGPGLGGIQPSQADYFQITRGGGNGDYRVLSYAPASVRELAELVIEAFDVADQYRNPVMIAADGLLGQMMEPVDMEEAESRPRRILPEKAWAMTGTGGRRKPNIINSLILNTLELEAHCQKLQAKYREMAEREARAESQGLEDAEIVIVAFGTMARIVRSAQAKLRSQGIRVGLIRPITLWPFPVRAFAAIPVSAKCVVSMEMSCGQMIDDVRIAVNGRWPVEFFGRTGGVVPTVAEVVESVVKLRGRLA